MRQSFHEQRLVHLRGRQDEYTVPAILVITIRPRYAGTPESTPQGRVQAITHGNLMWINPAAIAEALHVHNENGPVNSGPRHRHPLRNRETSDLQRPSQPCGGHKLNSGTTWCGEKQWESTSSYATTP
jgi:hypothetical protein